MVGVSASAGGLEAFFEVLTATPPDAGVTFVFVLHLPPYAGSHLADALGRRTALPIQDDGVRVEPNRVYVIRPGQVLTLRDAHLRLRPELGDPRAATVPTDTPRPSAM